MKKIFTLFYILTIASCSLFSQSMQLMTLSGTVIPNGGTVYVPWSLYDTTVDVNVELKIKNVSSSSITVKALKIVKVLPGTQKAYYCFAGFCFGDTVTVSPNELKLDAGVTDENFSAHVNPWASTGNSVVYYRFYTTSNPQDTVSVYIQSKVWHLGMNDLSVVNTELGNAYPNPANDKFTVEYSVSGQETARLVLQNVLGAALREEAVPAGSGKVQMNVTGLPEGVYLYSLLVNGKNVSTRKLLIRH